MSDLGTNVGSIVLSTVSNTVEIGETWTINESAIMYMRPKTVAFYAQGLKPNTVYYPFFNNVDVSSCCSIYDNQISSTIITDNIGSVKGNFYLPAATFVCGSHTFMLVDSVKTTNNEGKLPYIPDPQYGRTEAIYEASGTLKQQQKQITTLTIIDTPNPIVPIAPLPPVIIYPPPQIPEPIPPIYTGPPDIVAPPPNPVPDPLPPTIPEPPKIIPITDPSGVGCELWRYDYRIISKASKSNYTVSSGSSTPPAPSTVNPVGIVLSSDATINYLKTDKITTTKWNHTYTINNTVTNRYRKFRNHYSATVPPNILQYDITKKPSGLLATDTYEVITPIGQLTPWVYVGKANNSVCTAYLEKLRVDPLAQSFYIDANSYPSGIYATSIAVYFKKVDQSTPVILELRNVVNGLPGSSILPGGMVILNGTSTIQSDNASIPTIFKFDNPIYLAPKTDFCFVLKSSSLGYDAWCSRFGDIDIISGKVIDEQPFNGVLFKSSNNDTWTPVQYEDIKFDLNIAEFNINVDSTLALKPHYFIDSENNLNYYNTKQTLPLSYISTIENSSIVTVIVPMHGLQDDDQIYFGDFPDTVNGISKATFSNKLFDVTVIDEDTISINTGSSADRTGSVLAQDLSQAIDNIPPTTFNTTSVDTVPFNNGDNNTLAITPTGNTLTYPTPPKSITESSFEIYTNVVVNEVSIDYLGTELPNTEIIEEIKLISDVYGIPNSYTEIDKNTPYAYSTPKLIASGVNELVHNNTANNNAKINLTLTSSDKNISPSIDLNGISLITKSYKIDNQNGEISGELNGEPASIYTSTTNSSDRGLALNDPEQNSEIDAGTGNAAAKYKSKVVHLSTPSKRISVFVTGNAKSPCVIDAYVRLSNDESTHMDQDWKWTPLDDPKTSDNTTMNYMIPFSNSINDTTVNEWYYEYISEETFTIFDIKLVMRSTNSSIIPKIYGIRTITNIA